MICATRKSISVAIIFSMFFIFQNRNLKATDIFEDLKQTYHFVNQLNGWTPSGEPQIFIGDDLFLFIDGGAEIYQEYGFIRVMSVEYKKRNNRTINLEIYEMKDSESAYGIFTYKTGKKGKKMTLGYEARLEDYYLNFWKGNFLVTLTGFDSDKETIKGLTSIGRAVEKKIKAGRPDYPLLVKLLHPEIVKNGKTIYLKGNLALYNFYPFGDENIFGLKEGIILDSPAASVLIFKYFNARESLKWFLFSRDKLKQTPGFKIIASRENTFKIRDNKKKVIFLKPLMHYIIIIMSDSGDNINSLFQEVIRRLEKND